LSHLRPLHRLYPLNCRRIFLSLSSPLLLSAVLKMLSLSSTTLRIKKRLVLKDDNNHASKKPKKKTHRIDSKVNHQEPKLAAYDIDWFDSASTTNKCLKHTSSKNLPVTQEGQLTFLLSKYQASDIKTAFADAIGKVSKAARKVFYPLPLCKEKLISYFLELIYDGKSIMFDNSKDSFR
jgi:hypothetical protein